MHEKNTDLNGYPIPSLAIATVPCQKWSGTCDPNKALCIGTIFPELNMPFYAASTVENRTDGGQTPENGVEDTEDPQTRLLKNIDEISFVINDLTLYLDTHDTDSQALALFGKTLKKREELMKEFAVKYYPLTQDCLAGEGNEGTKFRWTDGPAPWEGV